MMFFVRLAVACMLLAPAAIAAPGQSVQIPVQPVPDTHAPPSPLPATLWLPDGGGRHAAVILLHGCGGLGNGREMARWAERLNGWGYAAIAPDSFAPRGVSTVCAPDKQPLVTPMDRSGDVLNTALYLRTLPAIDPGRIAVIGFSHGGGTAATVTRREFQDLHPGLLKAAVDYYGPCRQPRLHGTVPLLVLAGLDDTWGNPAKTCGNFGEYLGSGQPFQIFTYPDTVHAFDNPGLLRRRFNEGHPMQYNYAAASDSFVRVHEFLERWTRP